jgi:hypothetical protein
MHVGQLYLLVIGVKNEKNVEGTGEDGGRLVVFL